MPNRLAKAKSWLCAALFVVFGVESLAAMGRPAKITCSEKRITETTLAEGSTTIACSTDKVVNQVHVWHTPSLDGVIEVEPTLFETMEPGTDYELTITLLGELTQTHGGTVHFRENGTRTLPKPINISLKFLDGDGEVGEEGEGEDGEDDEDRGPFITWEIDEVTEEFFANGENGSTLTVTFQSRIDLADIVTWTTPSLDGILEVTPFEYPVIEKGQPYELTIELLVPWEELPKNPGGTIHLRGGARTYSQPLSVNILRFPEEADEEAVPAMIVGAADYEAGPVVGGQIVTIFGSDIGPDAPASLVLNSEGKVSDYLGETQVLFDGIPAPLLLVQDNQANAVVPLGIAGKSHVEMLLTYRGKQSAPFLLPVGEVAPALFTLDASGSGQGAILNEDLTVNSPQNPARRGSIVVLYATGGGPMSPQGADGEIVGDELPRPTLPVEVRIDGVPAQVLYAGGAPGLVNAVIQVNVQLPFSARSGTWVPVILKVGGVATDGSVTVAIQ